MKPDEATEGPALASPDRYDIHTVCKKAARIPVAALLVLFMVCETFLIASGSAVFETYPDTSRAMKIADGIRSHRHSV